MPFLISKALAEKPFKLPEVDCYDPQRPFLLRIDRTCTCKICKVAKMDFAAIRKRGNEDDLRMKMTILVL